VTGQPEEVLLVPRLEVTETAWEATVGLLGREVLEKDQGLLIERCRCVHTWFMRFAIDLVYLTRDGEVCKVVTALPPWRFSACRKAASVLELPSGQAAALGLTTGKRIAVVVE
jgi:uncharacterized membrane protein (UPF0127 family)